jgi:hypothetical protein
VPAGAAHGGAGRPFRAVVSGGLLNGDDWDSHAECDKNHQRMAGRVDKPIAGLLEDLKARGCRKHAGGLGRRFRRTRSPTASFEMEAISRRADHNPYGFSMWMAGGGIGAAKSLGRPTRSVSR